MPHYKRFYFKQKLILYFDENFPISIINKLKLDRQFKKSLKISSAYDFNNENKDDDFQYSFCKKNNFVLVTLDRDFMSDRKYPIQKIPGIILIVSGKNQIDKIRKCLTIIISFLSFFPRPKTFMGDSKFQVSMNGCIMRGRDSKTREIKTVPIVPGDMPWDVANKFHYFG